MLMLVSCASKPNRIDYDVATANPAVVSIYCGGAWSANYRWVADGNHACRETYQPKTKRNVTSFELAHQHVIVPSDAAWQKFWKKLDPLQIPKWSSTYKPEKPGEGPTCGGGWYVTYETQKEIHASEGSTAAYPKFGNVHSSTLDGKAINDLIEAFEALFPTPLGDEVVR